MTVSRINLLKATRICGPWLCIERGSENQAAEPSLWCKALGSEFDDVNFWGSPDSRSPVRVVAPVSVGGGGAIAVLRSLACVTHVVSLRLIIVTACFSVWLC